MPSLEDRYQFNPRPYRNLAHRYWNKEPSKMKIFKQKPCTSDFFAVSSQKKATPIAPAYLFRKIPISTFAKAQVQSSENRAD